MSDQVLTKELLRDEALTVLRTLRDNAGAGRSNRLADVKESLTPMVKVDFDDYFLFLRKHSYIALEHGNLELTPDAVQMLDHDAAPLFAALEQFFAARLGDELNPTFSENAPTEIRRSPTASLPSVDIPMESQTNLKRQPPLVAPPLSSNRSSFDGAPPPRPPEPAAKAEPPTPRPFSDKAEGAGAKEARGTELDLRYVKYDPLGGGALGTVFRGKQTALGTEVAIKELRDIFGYFSFLQRGEVIKRLKKEICSQAQLRHPGVVLVLDQNTEVTRPYFVMELLPGGSLRQKLDAAAGKPLPIPQALRYFLQMAYALRAAHASGLLHQNLKPENMLLDGAGNVKLSDFGLTRVLDTDVLTKQLPQIFLGTGGMGYMPPELLSNKKEFGPEGDIYMLGLVLYEMITGNLPGRRSPLPSSANSAVPVKVDPVFDRMTQDKRDARYPNVDAMLDDFYQAFSDGRFLRKGNLLLYAQPPDAVEATTSETDEAHKRSAVGGTKDRIRPV